MKTYYLIIYSDSNKPEIYSFCNETIFTKDRANQLKEKWDKQNYPYKSILVTESK